MQVYVFFLSSDIQQLSRYKNVFVITFKHKWVFFLLMYFFWIEDYWDNKAKLEKEWSEFYTNVSQVFL